jgi:hypothetical protein
MRQEQPKSQPAKTQLPSDLPNPAAEPGFVPASFEPQPESLASPPQTKETPQKPEEFPAWSESPSSPAHPALEAEPTPPAKPSQLTKPDSSPQQAASKPQPAKTTTAKPLPKGAHPVVKEPIPLVPDTPVPADWVQKPTKPGKTIRKTSSTKPEPNQQSTHSTNTPQAAAPAQMPAAAGPSVPTTRIVVTDKTVIPEVIAPPDETKKPSKMPANIPSPLPVPVLGKVEFTTEAQPTEPPSSATEAVSPPESQPAFPAGEAGRPAPQDTDFSATQPAPDEAASDSAINAAIDATGGATQSTPAAPIEASRSVTVVNSSSAATATTPAISPSVKQASQSNPTKPAGSKTVANTSKKGKPVVHFPELSPEDTGNRKHHAAPRKVAKASKYTWPRDYKPYLPPADATQREIHTQAVHHFNRGNYYGRKKNLEQAVAEYRRAVVLNPAFADAYVGLSSVHVLKNDWESVYEETSKAFSLKKGGFMDPANIVQAKFNLTMAHCATAEKWNALKSYRQVKTAGHPLSQQLWIHLQHSCKP